MRDHPADNTLEAPKPLEPCSTGIIISFTAWEGQAKMLRCCCEQNAHDTIDITDHIWPIE
jgi:hypothetical protein